MIIKDIESCFLLLCKFDGPVYFKEALAMLIRAFRYSTAAYWCSLFIAVMATNCC